MQCIFRVPRINQGREDLSKFSGVFPAVQGVNKFTGPFRGKDNQNAYLNWSKMFPETSFTSSQVGRHGQVQQK